MSVVPSDAGHRAALSQSLTIYRHRLAAAGLAAVLLLVLAGCEMAGQQPPKSEPPAAKPVEGPALTIAAASARERDGALRFTVSLSEAAGTAVTAAYATEDGSATAGADYTAVSGRLTFPPESTAAQRIEVGLLDDRVVETEETLTVRLSDPQGATLAAATATGTIQDDDSTPELSIGDASVAENAGRMRFEVRLTPASGRTVTVAYATEDGTATAGEDYASTNGTLTFAAGATAATIGVAILVDDIDEEQAETFTITLSSPSGATLADAGATGTITDDDDAPTGSAPPDPPDPAGPPDAPDAPNTGPAVDLELQSLTVTGGSGAMYPAFAAGVHHYAIRCTSSTTLRVQARASRAAARVTLLRADASDNQAATGSLDASVAVSDGHDVVVELRDGSDTATYVVHCIPTNFPEVRILKKTASVSDGLLLVTPRSQLEGTAESVGAVTWMAILDNDGVPRFYRQLSPRAQLSYSSAPDQTGHGSPGRNFRRLADGRYSLNRYGVYVVEIYDAQLRFQQTVRPLSPLQGTDEHDFLITPEGNYLLVDDVAATRDKCDVQQCEPDETMPIKVRDSWIQELAPDGTRVFEWNSWDHLKISDCKLTCRISSASTPTSIRCICPAATSSRLSDTATW